MHSGIRLLLLLLATVSLSESHTVITYPGWRGNNLLTNATFPYGMQWMYPCGGLTLTQNRTYWPTSGGTIAFQPGWFVGHSKGFLQINIGFGNSGPDGGPLEMTTSLVPRYAFLGPSNSPFPGTTCFPNVSLPDDAPAKAGDNATIQIVLSAQHGAALFSCVDITLVEPGDRRIPGFNETTCFNSTDIGFADWHTLTIKQSSSSDHDLLQQRLR